MKPYYLFLALFVAGLAANAQEIQTTDIELLAEDAKPLPPCDILAKLAEPDPAFESLELSVGEKTYTHYEIRRGKRQKYTQPEKEIGLRVLHLDTCTTEVIKIWKRGNIPESPPGWHIQVEVRNNGIQWNGVNSQFDIEEPLNTVLLANKVPDIEEVFGTKTVKGKDGKLRKVKVRTGWKVVDNKIYSPYTLSAHRSETVSAGDTYLQDLLVKVYADLRDRQVYSRAFPGRLVADVFPSEWFYRLALVEFMDYQEYGINAQWKQWSAERVLVLLALNLGRMNIYNCNYAGACGMMQFTDKWRTVKGKRYPGTYSTIVQRYPSAELDPRFPQGAQDHFNIMKAAVLHHDNIAVEQVTKYGPSIVENPYWEGTLGARYNASLKSTQRAELEALKKNNPKWAGYLRKSETRGYDEKRNFVKTFTPNGAPLPPAE